MKHIIQLSIAIILFLTACKQTPKMTTSETAPVPAATTLNYAGGERSTNRLFPDKLRNMPNEIIAAHYPNPCYASFEDSMYIWKHNITIQVQEDMQIVEYGSFVYTDKGWYLRVSLTPADFEKSFNCKGAFLKKGVIYTDIDSWRRGDKLTAGDAMWFFIAKNKNGKLIKGMAPIETEDKVLVDNSRTLAVIKSQIKWTGYGEIGGYSLSGTMKIKNTSIQADSAKLTGAKIIFDVNSIQQESSQLIEHLKGKDFFNVAKFPEAMFVAEELIYTDASNAVAKGKLTIKGITKQMNIPLKLSTAGNNLKISGKIKVDRTAFGIKYNSSDFFSNLGDQAIKNNFDLEFEIAANY